MKARKIIYYFAGSILIAVMFIFVLELSTRTISWLTNRGFKLSLHEFEAYDQPVESKYKWHPFTGITFRPNTTFTAGHPYQKGRSKIFVDGHGFLTAGKQIPSQKAANEIRIATIGGSTTANVHLSYRENWPGYLGRLVHKALPNKTVTVINAGVPGYDTAQSIGTLALRVIPLKPDIVIIYHAYNDLKAIRADVKFRPDYSHIHNTPFGYHQKPNFIMRLLNHSMFYVRTRNQYRQYINKKKLIDSYNDAVAGKNRLAAIPKEALLTFEQHIRSLVALAKGAGAKVILSSFATLHDPDMDVTSKDAIKKLSEFKQLEFIMMMHFTPGLKLPAIFEGIKQYNQVLEHIAAKEGTGWVDNAALVPHARKYFVDRVHFSRQGAKRMAENFLPVVLKQLQH